ncbi:MAG: tyrosine-type recombinase/integrase [Bacteroidales bacterium]
MINRFLTYLSSEKRYSAHTLKAYGDDLMQFKIFLETQYGEKDIVKADTLRIRAYVVALVEEGMAEGSIHRKISSLKSFYKYCIRQGILEVNPAYKLPLPKTKQRLPVFVDQGRMQQITDREVDLQDFAAYRDYLVVEFFYATGMRLAELLGLLDKEVDIMGRTVKVLGKRNKERLIPIPILLEAPITQYRMLRQAQVPVDCDYFFVNLHGEALSRSHVYQIVKKCLATYTSLSKCSPHVLRHTYATHLLNEGADLNAVKELLGHSSLAATQVYTHNSIEQLKKSYINAHHRA